MARNLRLDEALVVKALAHLFDLGDEIAAERISDYGYPQPDQPHPVPNEPQVRRIEQGVAAADGRVQVTPIMHGYGPLDDSSRRLKAVVNSAADGVWINRMATQATKSWTRPERSGSEKQPLSTAQRSVIHDYRSILS